MVILFILTSITNHEIPRSNSQFNESRGFLLSVNHFFPNNLELNILFFQFEKSPGCQIEILFLDIYIGHHSYPSTSFREKDIKTRLLFIS